MTKGRIYAIVVVAAWLGAGAVYLQTHAAGSELARARGRDAQPGSLDAPHQQPSGAQVPRLLADVFAPPARPSSSPAPDVARLKPDQEALLRLYDELSEALEASDEDCEALAYGFSTAIEAARPELLGLIAQQSAAAGPSAQPVDSALVVQATQRVIRFNAAINRAMPRCSAQLLPELSTLTGASKFRAPAGSAQLQANPHQRY